MKSQCKLDLFRKTTLIFLFIGLSSVQIYSQKNHNIFLLNKSYRDGITFYQHEVDTLNPLVHFILNESIKNPNSEILLDSIVTVSSNGTTNYKCSYNYDLNRRASSLNIDLWFSDHWEKDWLYEFSYDDIGNLITVLHESWDGSKYEVFGREAFNYDSNRNRLSGLFERWDDSLWVNDFRYNYSYDSNGNIVQDLFEYWIDSTWLNISRIVYIPEDSQTNYLYQLWDNNTWIDNRKGLFEYDSEGKLIFNTVKILDDSQWVNYLRVTFNYNPNGNQELNLIEMWNGSQWVNSDKISYTYNPENYFTYALYEIWKNSEWIHEEGGISIENPPGYRLGFITCEMFAYYGSPTNVREEEFLTNNYELFNNYPNPFNPTTTVSWQSPVGSWQTLKIYDILGREIATLVDEYKPAGKYKIEFSAEDLSSGVYFYTITAGNFTQTKKMILAK